MIENFSKEHAFDVCLAGQGALCCKYLMVGAGGFECAKDPGNEGFRRGIERKEDMTAKSDNCRGFHMEKLEDAR